MAKRTMAKRTIVSPEPVRRSYFNLPWSQVGAEGWAVWAFSVAAIGTAIQLMQLFRGELFRGELFRGKLDLFCHRMWSSPDKVDSRRLSCRDRGWTLRRERLFSEVLFFVV
jgi:hypothetical protein